MAAADPLPDVPAKTQQTGVKPQVESDRERHVGKGSPWDKTKTGRALRKAAAQGDANAQYGLGCVYAGAGARWTGPNRYGVLQDFEEAVFWWKKAADQGNDRAQLHLGDAYTEGEGVPQDHVEAARWYRKSADQGNTTAQSLLGSACAKGEGVLQDYPEAVRWWKKAADHGDVEAQLNLGVSYAKGEGVPQDYAEAYFWANLASALNKDAKKEAIPKLRDSIGAALPREQLSATQKRCRQWMDAFEKRKAQK
ncbi:MAG: tetratricopeptide repeat protein [Polyangia bacterium]